MSEREPRDISQTAAWAVDRIAEHMEQTPKPLHVGKGIDGFGFTVIDPEDATDARTLALFPDQKVVMISTPEVEIKIKNATAWESKSGVRVTSESGHLRALFLKDGHVAIEVFPASALALSEPPLSVEKPSAEDLPDSPPPIDPRASGDEIAPSQEAAASPQTSEQKEQQPRVKFTGRLGAAPHFEQSQKSGLIARFPVAEHTADDQVTWHRVYSTGERAQRIQNANLDKGTKVKVDGYRQTRDIKRKDGTVVKQEVVFAVHVKKLAGATAQAAAADEE